MVREREVRLLQLTVTLLPRGLPLCLSLRDLAVLWKGFDSVAFRIEEVDGQLSKLDDLLGTLCLLLHSQGRRISNGQRREQKW